jgi:hypothetical protein
MKTSRTVNDFSFSKEAKAMSGKATGTGILCVAACLLSLSVTRAAFGSLLAYDGFSGYAENQTIINKSMLGSGFAAAPAAWRGSALYTGGDAVVKAGGLTYSQGGADLDVSGDQSVDQHAVGSYVRAELASPVNSGIVYMSALAMAPTTYSGQYNSGPYITVNDPNVDAAVAIPHDGAVHLAVIKFDLGTLPGDKSDDTYTTWIDPVPGSLEADNTPKKATTSLSSDAEWSGTLQYFAARGDWEVSFDEVRFGTTWADVTAAAASGVPEPSSFVLAALGLVGLGMLVRRRRVRR